MLLSCRCGSDFAIRTKSGFSVSVAELPAWEEVGSDRSSAGIRSLKVVVMTKKIKTTINTSIKDTIITEGADRFFFGLNSMFNHYFGIVRKGTGRKDFPSRWQGFLLFG